MVEYNIKVAKNKEYKKMIKLKWQYKIDKVRIINVLNRMIKL